MNCSHKFARFLNKSKRITILFNSERLISVLSNSLSEHVFSLIRLNRKIFVQLIVNQDIQKEHFFKLEFCGTYELKNGRLFLIWQQCSDGLVNPDYRSFSWIECDSQCQFKFGFDCQPSVFMYVHVLFYRKAFCSYQRWQTSCGNRFVPYQYFHTFRASQ